MVACEDLRGGWKRHAVVVALREHAPFVLGARPDREVDPFLDKDAFGLDEVAHRTPCTARGAFDGGACCEKLAQSSTGAAGGQEPRVVYDHVELVVRARSAPRRSLTGRSLPDSVEMKPS